MAKIVEVRQSGNNNVYLAQPMSYLVDRNINNITLDVRYEGQTEFETISLYDLVQRSGQRGEYEAEPGHFYMVCDKPVFYENNTIPANQPFEYELYSRQYNAEFLRFNNFYTKELNGELTLTITAHTDFNNTGTFYEITFDLVLSVNGYSYIQLKPKQTYFSDLSGKRLSISNYDIDCFDAHNNRVDFDFSQEGIMFISKTFSSTNIGTYDVIFENDLYEKGKYRTGLYIYPGLYLQPFTFETDEYCYESEPSELVVNVLKDKYLQFEYFSNEDIKVYERHEINETDYYDEEVFYYGVEPNRFVSVVSNQQVNVSYGSFTTQYYVNVFGIPKDNVYYFDKKSPFSKHLLGELQCDFNMSFALDEGKDSCKIVILSFVKKEIEPNTIVLLESTNTWWCVQEDNVIRHENEQETLYEHNIKLVGAIELLNSRDLTDCGFNSERYTVSQFLSRLSKLSDTERNIYFNLGANISGSERVNYLKTFQNYTTLSAIKEFFNGYNCIPKMTPSIDSLGKINNYTIYAYSKSGNEYPVIDESVFDDRTEQTTISKENYATRVVSNIQNCVSKSTIRYPNIGAVQLVGENGEITYQTADSATLRLPTDAYYVESITFYNEVVVNFYTDGDLLLTEVCTPDDLARNGNKLKNKLVEYLELYEYTQEQIDYVNDNWESIFSVIKDRGVFELKNGGYYDAISDEKTGSYLVARNNLGLAYPKGSIFLNNDIYSYNSDGRSYFNLTWQQGSNKIGGFGLFAKLQSQAFGDYGYTYIEKDGIDTTFDFLNIKISQNANRMSLIDYKLDDVNRNKTLFSVNYVPMTDLKVKTENDRDYHDIKLFNQNGKLIDSYAVSKLINGYAQSVSSNEIVKNKTYYNFFDIPKVGQRVNVGNEIYVINNVSIDFTMNDNLHYCMPCQFTMTKQSACKSFMVNANSKIRDYDCPQQNNVKRIQCYRDYIEIDYTLNSSENTYLDFNALFNLGRSQIGIRNDLCALTMATDSNFRNIGDNNSHHYYYRLNCTNYSLNKHYVIVADYNDNNIIGYGNASAEKPFTFEQIFDREKTITAPISYVDKNGELEELQLIFTTISDLESAYGKINIDTTCAISGDIYRSCYANKVLSISETDYDKDGLEVPVFEYSAECGDTNGIVIADDIFEYGKGYEDFYIVESSNVITNENKKIVSLLSKKKVNMYYNSESRLIKLTAIDQFLFKKGKNYGLFAKNSNNEYRFILAINYYNCVDNRNYCDLYVNTYKLK